MFPEVNWSHVSFAGKLPGDIDYLVPNCFSVAVVKKKADIAEHTIRR